MKLHMYEGGIRVPGIIRWPGKTQPGSVSSEPVNGTDVLPTLCEIAGADVPKGRPIDGASILPIFRNRKLKRAVPLYWRYDHAISKPFTVAMRQGDWKIVADASLTRFELYNLKEDPAEKNDLSQAQPRRLARMKDALKTLHAQIDAEGPKWPGG